jgi:hypothetical protein
VCACVTRQWDAKLFIFSVSEIPIANGAYDLGIKPKFNILNLRVDNCFWILLFRNLFRKFSGNEVINDTGNDIAVPQNQDL